MLSEVIVGNNYISKSGKVFGVMAIARHGQNCSEPMVVYINMEPTSDAPIGTI